MQGLVAEATLERKLRLFQDVCSNGFKVVAGRKNIGHGQRDRFLETEALARFFSVQMPAAKVKFIGVIRIVRRRPEACRRRRRIDL